jgi:hypothetical protein
MKGFSFKTAAAILAAALVLAGCENPTGGGGNGGDEPGNSSVSITLRGTVDITVNGETPYAVEISLVNEYGYPSSNWDPVTLNNYAGGSAAWSMAGNYIGGDWYFRIGAQLEAQGGWLYKTLDAPGPSLSQAGEQTGIALGAAINALILSGTSGITVNGAQPYGVRIAVERWDNYTETLGVVTLTGNNDGAWSVPVEQVSEEETLHLTISVQDSSGAEWRNQDSTWVTVSPGDTVKDGIAIYRDYTAITLSGTVNLTVDGKRPDWVEVRISRPGWGTYSVYVNNYGSGANAWSYTMTGVTRETVLSFGLRPASYGYYEVPATVTVRPGDTEKRGITLNASLNTVTINGSVNAAVNGQRPTSVNIFAYPAPFATGYNAGFAYTSGGSTSWTMSVLTAGEKKTLYFRVYENSSGGGTLQNWWHGSLTINPGEQTKTVDLGDMVLSSTGYRYITITDVGAVQEELDSAYTSGSYGNISHANENAYTQIYVSLSSSPPAWTFMWLVDGEMAAPSSNDSVVDYSIRKDFYAKDYEPGTHYVTLIGIKNGLFATREFTFTVTE